MRTPINSSSLIAFLLCHLLSACLAIGPNGGNGGGPENPVPGARGDAEDEQGTSAAVDIAFEELRIKIPDLLQRNFCFLCILACSSPEVLQSESVQSLPQSLRAYVLEMRSKLATITRAKYASSGLTRADASAECTNLIRDHTQSFISRQIYETEAGAENDILHNTDSSVRILALEQYREYFGFDSQKEYSCSGAFEQQDFFLN